MKSLILTWFSKEMYTFVFFCFQNVFLHKMNRFSLKTDHGKSISWKISHFPRVFRLFAPGGLSGGDTCVSGGDPCVSWGDPCVSLGDTCVSLGDHPGVISLFFPPCFFSNPFFSGSCLCFFKIPFFPPIEFFYPPRAPSKKNLHGISPSFFFGSCLCFFSFPFFLPKENVHPPRVSKNST